MPLSPSDRALGDLLVGRRVISLPQLDEAVDLAERWNVRLGDALLSRNWMDPRLYYEAYAQNFDLPFVDLIRDPPDRKLLRAAEIELYASRLTLPWRHNDGRLLIATAEPGPETLLFARGRWGNDIEFVVVSKFDIIVTVQTAFAKTLSRRAVLELAELDPQMSARTVFTPPQLFAAYGLVSAVLAGLAFAPLDTLVLLNVAVSIFYLGNFVFKGVLVSVGGGRSADIDETIAVEARALRTEELPIFTVLVPMFKEAAMLPQLAQAMRNLDYPLGKLDIKIVLEADDTETIEAARSLGLEGVFEIILVPRSEPQTKPKACNFALRFARGEYLVVYDAEDRPEPDQLRKVVATFRRSPPNTACLQCRLNYYNAGENWLTRMFTLDYALWFDQVLPGLERLGIPIPLGGTSNHFRIDVLRELRAWDPFNVTEDADLGIRIGQKGYRVGIVDSTTYEEASCRTGQWLRQRSRWIKGYMQTLLVHTRRPLHLIRTSGILGFFGFIFFVGGTVLTGLLNPVFWALYLIWLALSAASFDPIFPQALLFLCLFNLLAGNGAFTYLLMLAPIRRGWLQLIPYQLHAVRLLGADLAGRLPGALAAHPRSVLLGKDAARPVPPCRGANAGGRRRAGNNAMTIAVSHSAARSSVMKGTMTRALAAAPLATLAFVAIVALTAVAVSNGLIADDALRLWAGASTAADGQVPMGRIVAAYPTLPFLATTLVAWLAPADTPAPALVAAGLLAVIAAFCFTAFRKARLPKSVAAIATLLVAFHPALLRAVIAGPADMFLAAFLLMLCLALYDLRARSGTSEVMSVGLALMALAFSHPLGAAFAFAAMPFLVFAVRPVLVAHSAFNVVIALIFPTVFAIAAFSYVSWIFPGDGWTFLAAPTQGLSLWTAAVTRAFGDRLSGLLCALCECGDGRGAGDRRAHRGGYGAVGAPAPAARRARRNFCRHRDRRDGDQRAERLFRRSDRDRDCGAGFGRDDRHARPDSPRTSRPDHGAFALGLVRRPGRPRARRSDHCQLFAWRRGARRRRTDRRADRGRGGRQQRRRAGRYR